MKNALPFILLLSVSFAGIAQTAETKYYRSKPFEEEVPQAKAKYSETTVKENGTVTTTVRNLKKDEIEHRDAWKGDEPVGVWIGLTGRGPEERDYDFEIPYGKRDCANAEALKGIDDFFKDNPAAAYTAPAIDGEKHIISFILNNLRYFAKARRNGIQGTVHLAFTITDEGQIQNIVVTQGVHLLLDKEAVRLFRKLKLSSPPLLNGKPQEVCVKMPLRFKLA